MLDGVERIVGDDEDAQRHIGALRTFGAGLGPGDIDQLRALDRQLADLTLAVQRLVREPMR